MARLRCDMGSAVSTEMKDAGGGRALALVAKDIKLAHSVFAMPFAILGAFLAGPFDATRSAGWEQWRPFLIKLALIVACMVSARTWAMVVNRLADRAIDARNARTRARVFASGEVSASFGAGVLILCATLFVATTSLFHVFFHNLWPLLLSLPVLAWIAFYSYTKRFTALCHVVLGSSLAMSPLAAALAVDPDTLVRTPALWCISGFVLFWVAGFDVLYALQDEAFDRAHALRSIPARFGSRGAIIIARFMHAIAAIALVCAWWSETRFGVIFLCGVLCACAMMVAEHREVARHQRASGGGAATTPTLHPSWFTLNGLLGVVLGLCGGLDVLL